MKARAQGGWVVLHQRSAKLRRDLQQLWIDVRERLKVAPDDLSASKVLTGELAKWQEAAAPIIEGSRELFTKVDSETKAQVQEFDQRIASELTARGHVVHGEAPLLIVDGIVHIDIDAKEIQVAVNGVAATELTLQAVALSVEHEVSRLRELLQPPKKMLEDMLLAYQREIRMVDKQPGTQVQATAILMQLAFLRQPATFRSNPQSRSFREYPRDLFRADLFTLLADGVSAINGQTMRYASGSDTAGAIFMLVPAMGRAAHLGRIWFERSGE